MTTQATKTVFMTGVSSGIGHALVGQYLDRGYHVFGLSRRRPGDLADHAAFSFVSYDLRDHEQIKPVVATFLKNVPQIDVAILNAGVLGSFGDLADAELTEMRNVFDVNVWANKSLLDALFSLGIPVRQVVTMSSGAAVNGNRGWRGYAISKAALNMLTALYAAERPQTHFCALAPGLVDTAMQDQLAAVPQDERFASLEVIRGKRHTAEMPSPEELAGRLIEVIGRLPQLVTSGEFADIRKPPIASSTL